MIDPSHLLYTTEAVEAVTQHKNVVELLGINWKLFIAQLVNFGIILLILWKWVFTPVTTALQKRTEKIEKSMKDAEKVEQRLLQIEKYQAEQESQARAEGFRIVKQAEKDARVSTDTLLQEAKLRADNMFVEAQKKITLEQEKSVKEIKSQVADLVVAATEKILRQKLDSKKDEELIKQSLNNFK